MKKIFIILGCLFINLVHTNQYNDLLVSDHFLAQYGCELINFFVCEEQSLYEYAFLCKRAGKNFDQYLIFMKYKNDVRIASLQFQLLQSHLDWIVWRGDQDLREFFISESNVICKNNAEFFNVIYSESKNYIMQNFEDIIHDHGVKMKMYTNTYLNK